MDQEEQVEGKEFTTKTPRSHKEPQRKQEAKISRKAAKTQ
jgi:hypothetical protein